MLQAAAMFRPKTPQYSFVTIIAISLSAGLGCEEDFSSGVIDAGPKLEQGTVRHVPKPTLPFKLAAADGKVFTEQNLLGHWTWMYLGYANCPDICPLGLRSMAYTYGFLEKEYGSDNALLNIIQPIFVSVDPARDTPKRLQEFASFYHKKIIGIGGDLETSTALAESLGSMVSFPEGAVGDEGAPSNYPVLHPTSIFLFNPAGVLAAQFSPPHSPRLMFRAFHRLRTDYEKTRPRITDAWIPATAPGAKVMAGYLKLSNSMAGPIEVKSFEAEGFAKVEMHQTIHDNGSARMEKLVSMKIGPGQVQQFSPGAHHLMLLERSADLSAGSVVEMRLNLVDGRSFTFKAEVRAP